jgi:hypothetical protein
MPQNILLEDGPHLSGSLSISLSPRNGRGQEPGAEVIPTTRLIVDIHRILISRIAKHSHDRVNP